MRTDTDDEGRPDAHGLLRRLFWSRAGVLLLSMALLSLATLVATALVDNQTARSTMFAVATGVLASTVFTVAQMLLTSEVQHTALATTLSSSLVTTMSELKADIRSMQTGFLPTHTFGRTEKPNPEFNRILMQDLRDSDFYWFRGFSGRHAAARLIVADNRSCEIQIVMADPVDRESLRSRLEIMARMRPSSELDDIEQEMNLQIEIGLVGLYCARRSCAKVEIVTTPIPTIDRFEILNRSIWITLADDRHDNLRDYRQTHRFGEKAMLYGMERRDFRRIVDSATKKVTIRPNTTTNEFMLMYAETVGRSLDPQQLPIMIEQFSQFKDSFARAARLSA